MVTGNILQGLGRYYGKMVSYTTDKKTVEKGILLQEHYSPNEDDNIKGVVVPLLRAYNFILSQGYGKMVSLSHGITIINNNGGYTLRFPASKKKGGDFYLNEELINLTSEKKFEKVGTTMRATIPLENIKPLLKKLEDNFKVNIIVSEYEFERIQKQAIDYSGKVKSIEVPPKEAKQDLKIIQFKAKALIIKLKLLKQLKQAS